jgi:acyl-CoA synthetase (NDP forming)
VACAYAGHPTRSADVPVFDSIDAAAAALGHVTAYAEWRAQPEGELAAIGGEPAAAARRLVQEHLDDGRDSLGDVDAMALLDAVGLPVLRTETVADVREAQHAAGSMGYPVVLKAAGRPPTAKAAAAGFAIDLEGQDAVAVAWERMAEGLGEALTPVLVQPMVPPGVDVAVAVRDHPTVGPVLSLGLGGAAAALDTPVDVRVLPLTDLDAGRLVAGSRLAPALDGPNRLALESALLRVAALIEEVPEVRELTVNPLIVREGTVVVTQARATIGAIERDPLPPVRRA